MARFDIVGLNDDPMFAKAVKLSEKIKKKNPPVEFHTDMMDQFHWNEYKSRMKRQHGWEILRSPVVYEVLVDPNGKAHLIGDCNDFCDFAAMYFDIYYDPTSSALHSMAITNKIRYSHSTEDDLGDLSVFHVCIANAPTPLLELLIPSLLSPTILPERLKLYIHVLDAKADMTTNGVIMEAADMAHPSLFKISLSTNPVIACHQCDLFILAQDYSRGPIEEEEDWITRVEMQVVEIIAALNDVRTEMSDCRILVGGDGPSCYIAEMLRGAVSPVHSGPGRIIACGETVVQKAKSALSRLGAFPPGCVSGVQAWGWPGETGVHVELKDVFVKDPEFSYKGDEVVELPLSEMVAENDYVAFPEEFLGLQKKWLNHSVPGGVGQYMGLCEGIVKTVRVWLSSEPDIIPPSEADIEYLPRLSALDVEITYEDLISPPPEEEEDDEDGEQVNNNNKPEEKEEEEEEEMMMPLECYEAMNVGVPTIRDKDFPEGTYMVQPSICMEGRWHPLSVISPEVLQTFNERIKEGVKELWKGRERLIYRDKGIRNVFPEHDRMILGGVTTSKRKSRKEGGGQSTKSMIVDEESKATLNEEEEEEEALEYPPETQVEMPLPDEEPNDASRGLEIPT